MMDIPTLDLPACSKLEGPPLEPSVLKIVEPEVPNDYEGFPFTVEFSHPLELPTSICKPPDPEE